MSQRAHGRGLNERREHAPPATWITVLVACSIRVVISRDPDDEQGPGGPATTHAASSVAEAVRAARPTDGLTVWLLGNAGVLVVDPAGRRIAIDPWTSDW